MNKKFTQTHRLFPMEHDIVSCEMVQTCQQCMYVYFCPLRTHTSSFEINSCQRKKDSFGFSIYFFYLSSLLYRHNTLFMSVWPHCGLILYFWPLPKNRLFWLFDLCVVIGDTISVNVIITSLADWNQQHSSAYGPHMPFNVW